MRWNKGELHVILDHNTFIPGPRTKKEEDDGELPYAWEIDAQRAKKIKFRIHKLETNKIMFYDGFDVDDGNKRTIENGDGNPIPLDNFLKNVGCKEVDAQDKELKQSVLEYSQREKHEYDGLDDEPELWPENGWKHYS